MGDHLQRLKGGVAGLKGILSIEFHELRTMTILHVLYNLGQDTESVLGTSSHSLVAASVQLGCRADPGRLLLLLLGRRRWIRTRFPLHPENKWRFKAFIN